MLKSEIIYSILEKLRQADSDDSNFNEEIISYHIDNVRALLLKQRAEKGKGFSEIDVQTLTMDVNKYDASMDTSLTVGQDILRSVNKLPKLLKIADKLSIVRIGSLNLYDPGFNIVSYAQSLYSGNGRYNSNLVYAYLFNDYVYVKGALGCKEYRYLDKIIVRGIFEDCDTVDAKTKSLDCTDYDYEYPISADMLSDLESMVIQQVSIGLQIPEDEKNDANDLP